MINTQICEAHAFTSTARAKFPAHSSLNHLIGSAPALPLSQSGISSYPSRRSQKLLLETKFKFGNTSHLPYQLTIRQPKVLWHTSVSHVNFRCLSLSLPLAIIFQPQIRMDNLAVSPILPPFHPMHSDLVLNFHFDHSLAPFAQVAYYVDN